MAVKCSYLGNVGSWAWKVVRLAAKAAVPVAKGFGQGAWSSLKDTGKGIGYTIQHPIKTAANIGMAVLHPGKTFNSIYDMLENTVNTKIINGSAKDRAYVVGYLASEFGQGFITGGIAKVVKGAKTSKIASRVGKTGELIDDFSDLAEEASKVNRVVTTCFVAGTLISTPHGLIPIEKINVGDYVWSENPRTKEKALKKVVNTFLHEKAEIVHLLIKGKEILTTSEHPFYVEGKGFVEVKDLNVGDVLRLQSGKNVILEGIIYETLEKPIYVYNFEVEDFHTYYVGEECILVHNKAAIRKVAKINVISSADEVVDDFIEGASNPNNNRRQALNQAKDSAGIPRSQQPTRQWIVGDDITKKGGDYKNYEYSENATHHGRYYEYDTPQGKKVVVDHTNDVEQGLHTHAGEVPNDANPLTYDFKNPDNRYKPINKDTDHHIRYTKKR